VTFDQVTPAQVAALYALSDRLNAVLLHVRAYARFGSLGAKTIEIWSPQSPPGVPLVVHLRPASSEQSAPLSSEPMKMRLRVAPASRSRPCNRAATH
jgi:hypothetical protein